MSPSTVEITEAQKLQIQKGQPKRRWTRTRGFRLVVSALVSLVCLYLAVQGMDVEQTIEELRKSSPTPVLGAVFFLFLSFWIRALRWSYLLLPIKPISSSLLFRSTVIGFMGNYLLPFRAGELMRAVSIGQTENISKASAFGSIILERVFDGLVLSLTPFFLLAVLDLPRWLLQVNLVLLAIYLIGLSVFLVAARRGWTDTWLDVVTRMVPEVMRNRLRCLGKDFVEGIEGITRAGALLPVVYLSLLCWLSHGMYFFLAFQGLNLNLSVWAALVLQAVIALGVILPGTPGYVGNFEYFTVLGLALFGINQEAAFAFALVAHVFQFVPVTAVGLFFAFRTGMLKKAEVEQHRLSTSTFE